MPDEVPINAAIIVDGDYLNRFGDIFTQMLLGLIDVPVNITLICRDTETDISPLLGSVKILRFDTPMLPWRYNRQVQLLCDELTKSKIDLIHSCSGQSGRLAGDIAKRANIPYLISFTGLLQEECHLRIDEHLCKALMGISDPIVDMLRELYGRLDEKIHLIRPGCFFYERPVQEKKVKSIVSLGRLDHRSGYDVLLKALSYLNKQGKEIFTVILGTGPLESHYRRWIANNELRDSIMIIDPLAHWHKILLETDFYIQPGPFYSLNCGPYQALAHSCPIIASKDNAMDLIIEGQTGMLFPPGDAQVLADILIDWLDGKINREEMSAYAGRFAKQELSLTKNIDTTVNLYKSVID